MFLVASVVLLAAILVEWAFLGLRGAVGTRTAIGPAYYAAHILIFFLGTPALINALVLPNTSKWHARWWFALPLCTVLAFVLVVQQYAVSEALYGIEGGDGPFSEADRFH